MKHLITLASVLVLGHLAPAAERPNILICISDDQSWPHASAYGDAVVRTPAFDRITREGAFGDIDGSPTKRFLLGHRGAHPNLYQLAFGKRPPEELYDCRNDPDQIRNLAADPPSSAVLREMSARLTARLKAAGDPREVSGETPWDGWEYHGRKARETHPE